MKESGIEAQTSKELTLEKAGPAEPLLREKFASGFTKLPWWTRPFSVRAKKTNESTLPVPGTDVLTLKEESVPEAAPTETLPLPETQPTIMPVSEGVSITPPPETLPSVSPALSTATAYYYSGETLRAQGKNAEAGTAYRKAIEIKVDNYIYYIGLGRLFLDTGECNDALDAFTAARELAPDRSEAFYYSGEAYLGLSNYPLAVEQYQQAVVLNPKASSYLAALGDAYRLQGDCQSASLAYSQALALNAKDQRAIDGLAACAGQ